MGEAGGGGSNPGLGLGLEGTVSQECSPHGFGFLTGFSQTETVIWLITLKNIMKWNVKLVLDKPTCELRMTLKKITERRDRKDTTKLLLRIGTVLMPILNRHCLF